MNGDAMNGARSDSDTRGSDAVGSDAADSGAVGSGAVGSGAVGSGAGDRDAESSEARAGKAGGDDFGETAPGAAHYQRHRPDLLVRYVLNPFVNLLMRVGVSVRGSRILEHRGRSSGRIYHTPVNLLTIDGADYLVAPRGETQWVRNVRAADGRLVLILGRRRETRIATEVPVPDRPAILRPYLRRWKAEVNAFFDGVGPDSSEAEFARAAARHPVFSLGARPSSPSAAPRSRQ